MKRTAAALFALALAWLAAVAFAVLFPILVLIRHDRAYLFRLAIAADQSISAAVGWSEDMTISTQMADRRKDCALCRWLCRVLDKVDPGHCDTAQKIRA